MTPLALHLTHPTGGTWQVELVLAKPLVLSREGSVQVGHEHTDVDPELLIFDPAPVNFRLKGERRWGGIKAPQLVELNGDSVERGVVKAGDVLRWWDFVVRVVEVGPLSRARARDDRRRTLERRGPPGLRRLAREQRGWPARGVGAAHADVEP